MSDHNILTYIPGDFNYIRALIDVRLTAEDIDNDVIESSAYLGAAEKDALRYISKNKAWLKALEAAATANPDGEEADKLDTFKSAVFLRTASNMIPNVPLLLSQTVGGIRQSWQEFDSERIMSILLARSNRLLDGLTDDDPQPTGLTKFKTAQSERGGTWR